MPKSNEYFLNEYSFKTFIPSNAGNKKKSSSETLNNEGTPIHHILQDYFASNSLNNYTYQDLLNSYREFVGTKYVSDTDQNHLGIKIGNQLQYNIKKDKNTIHKAYRVIFILHHRFSIPYSLFIPPHKYKFLLGDYGQTSIKTPDSSIGQFIPK